MREIKRDIGGITMRFWDITQKKASEEAHNCRELKLI